MIFSGNIFYKEQSKKFEFLLKDHFSSHLLV